MRRFCIASGENPKSHLRGAIWGNFGEGGGWKRKMRRKMIKRIFVSILVMGMCVSNIFVETVVAANNKDSKSDRIVLDPIVVAASRLGENLSEVSAAVTIISEKEIAESRAKSVPDLLKNTEGVYVYDASGVGTAGRVNMRGFWGGMSTHQLVLIDGIPQNKGKDKLVDWDLISLENIERIEVLRGPASALYGDTAMSGVINIATKMPAAGSKSKVEISSGTFNTQDYKISTSMGLEKVGCYINMDIKSTDGFRKHSDYENMNLFTKLKVLPDDTQDLVVSVGYHTKENGSNPWALTESQVENDRRQARPGTENDNKKTKKFDLGATYHKEITKKFNMRGSFYYNFDDENGFYTSTSTYSSTREQIDEENTFGGELRANAKFDFLNMEHFLTSGIDLERNNVDYKEYNASNQIRGNIRSDYSVVRNKVGPYIQDEITFFDRLKVVTGLRYDYLEFNFDDKISIPSSGDRKMTNFTPKCGLVYTYHKESNLYVNYAQAFRSPTIGQMFTYGSSSNPNLDPEKANNYEIGLRQNFYDKLKANVSLYWMDLDNEIWYDYSDRQYRNYGKTSHRGVETGLAAEIFKNLTLFGNYAYTNAKNESGDYDGKHLTNIPLNKGGFGLEVKTDYGFKARLSVTMTGSSYMDSANEDMLKGYSIVDMGISYDKKWGTVFLDINNLFCKEYNSYGYKSTSGQKTYSPVPGITFNYGVKVRF